MKKDGLVLLKGNKALTTSVIVARELERPHKTIIKIINDHKDSFDKLGKIKYHKCKNLGHFQNDTTNVNNVNYYYLAEEHLTFLIMMMRVKKNENDKVLEFKIKIAKAFSEMKNIINALKLNQNDEEWKEIREESKSSRLKETDEIKKFVKYAEDNGSENADNYYNHFTDLIYDNLFEVQEDYKKFKNKKNLMDKNQLLVMMQGEYIIKNKINEYVDKEIEYHEAYQNIKKDIESFSGFIEITKIPYFEQLCLV